MTNYRLTILSVLSLVIISCNAENALPESKSTKKENKIVVNPIDTEKPENLAILPKTDNVPCELNDIYKVFYQKFCLGLADPRPILNENGFYVLDLKTYKDDMNSLNIFTKSFIDKQDEIFSECKNALANDSITPHDVPDGIDVSAPYECGFFHFNYYLGSQETPDGFYLRNSRWDASSSFSEIHFYTKVVDSFFTWDNQIILRVDLEKVKGHWKINNVKKSEN